MPNIDFTGVRPGYVLWDFPALSQTFVMNELRWLVSNGIDVRVYYAIDPDKRAELDFPVEAHRVSNVDELSTLISAHERTVMHSFFTYPAATVHAWPAARRTGIPFTFGAHAVDIFHYKNDGRNQVGALGRDPHCRRVLVPGAFHRAYLLERGVPSEKITISPQAVDLSGLRAHARPDNRHRPNGSRKVVCVARFVEKKGIADLILAAQQLSDLDLSVEIYGYGPLENEYRALIERHSITGVNIHGPINSRAEYVDVLTSSDLLVAPCVRASNGDMDGIPTVLMEAMALGAAVAASRASSIPDLVIDGETGLLMRPGDVDDIARTIRSFFGMEEAKRAALLMRAAARVEAKCSVEAAMCGLLGAWTAPGRSWNPRDTVARPASRLGG